MNSLKKILIILDKFIDLKILRNIIFFKNYFLYFLNYIIFYIFLSKKLKTKKKIILKSLPYTMAGVSALENCHKIVNYVNKKKNCR